MGAVSQLCASILSFSAPMILWESRQGSGLEQLGASSVPHGRVTRRIVTFPPLGCRIRQLKLSQVGKDSGKESKQVCYNKFCQITPVRLEPDRPDHDLTLVRVVIAVCLVRNPGWGADVGCGIPFPTFFYRPLIELRLFESSFHLVTTDTQHRISVCSSFVRICLC